MARQTVDTPRVTSVLDFINRIRTMQELPEWGAIPVVGTGPDSELSCVLAAALGVPVGGSADPCWADQGHWVMSFGDGQTARRVGIVTGQDWLAEPPEVRLPEALVDLAVSQHYDVVVPDDIGFVRGWWVPDADGFPVFLTPTDPLIPGDCGVLTKAA